MLPTLRLIVEVTTESTYQIALMTRKGKVRIAPINLKRALSVRPTIRKGNKRSQITGKKISKRIAIGQQATNNKHQRTTARNVRIIFFIAAVCKHPARNRSPVFYLKRKAIRITVSKTVQ